MTVTLTGENSFGLQGELKQLVATFVASEGELALERLDGEEADFPKIQEALTSLPFLAARKLIILRTPSKNKIFVEKFEQLLSDLPETTDVIITEPKLDKRLTYYKYLKSKTDFREFNDLDPNRLAQWLSAVAKERGGSLSSANARYLVDRVGLNQQLLGNELDKLLLYNLEATKQSIDLLTEETPQSTIFQLLEAAFSGQQRRALDLYKEQRAMKVEPLQIIALLAWQLHILAIIKTAGDRAPDIVAKEAKINPYVVRKSQAIARQLTITQLKKLIADLLQIDAASKRTSLDLDEALQHYLLTLAA